MKCPYNKCSGTGFIPVITPTGEQEFKPCSCRLERLQKDSIKRKRIDAKIPPIYWEYSLENYKELSSKFFKPNVYDFNKSQVSILEKYIENVNEFINGPRVLWIWGKEDNSCHTTLATILGDELLKHNYKVLFIEFYKLLEMFVDFDNKSEFFKNLSTYEIYIIDDAFDTTRCSPTKYKQGQLFGFLNDCLNGDKHLICTSNIPIIDMDPLFYQLQIILTRSSEELELRGSLTQMLRHR